MIRTLLGCTIAGVLFLAASVHGDEIKTLTNKSITGDIEKITEKEIILKTPTGPVTLPMAQVLDVILRPGRTLPAVTPFHEVQLLDDSLLRCSKVAFGAKETKLDLAIGLSLKVPNAAIHTYLRDAHEAGLAAQWAKLLRSRGVRDRVFVLRDGNLNPIDGALGAINEVNQTIRFTSDVKLVGVKDLQLDKTAGLQFARIQVQMEQPLCKVIDTDGNQLVASKLTIEAGQANLTTPFGAKLTFDAKWIARIDYNFGKLTFLSDLDAKVAESVLLGGFTPFRKDMNLDGNPLILQDKKYEKGLSIYAGGDLEYNLGGKYKEFKAVLGVDPRIAEEGQGVVTVSIYVDGKRLVSQEVSTKAVVPLAINVKDISALRIVVTGDNFTNYAGHATLANAHVSQ